MESTDRQLAGLVRSAGCTVVATVPMGDFGALTRTQSASPDVLLVDLRGQTRLPTGLQAFKRQHSQVGVVIVAAQLDPMLMLEAMRAGLTDWVTDPLSVPDLRTAIDRAVGHTAPLATSGKILAFLGAKGGVGTTTLAVNVAAVLAAESDSKVLLIDLHVSAYGDAALMLGAEPRCSVVDALENVHRLDAAFLDTLVVRAKPGLDLLASPERPSYAFGVSQLRALLDGVTRFYRCVILDVPHHDLRILDALEHAASNTLVVDQELSTIRRATKIASLLKLRHGRDKVSAVVMRHDSRADIGQNDIERVVGLPVWRMLPNDYRLALTAVTSGRPLVTDNKSRLPTAIRQLADRLHGSHLKSSKPDGGAKRASSRRLGFVGLF